MFSGVLERDQGYGLSSQKLIIYSQSVADQPSFTLK